MSGHETVEIEETRRDPTEAQIARLVQRLTSPEEGDHAVVKLTACGRSATGALKRFLLEGKPSLDYRPRRRAVEALAGIGAKETLIEFLKLQKDIPDPAVRLSEELVENAAAKAVALWRTHDVVQTLLDCALPHPRPGLVEALAEFDQLEAIPYFIRSLEDDTCRLAAEQAIRRIGTRSAVGLLAAALTMTSPEDESSASLKRRIRALDLLSEIGPPPAFWPLLRPLMDDSHADVVIAACNMADRIGSGDDKRAATRRLLAILRSADWFAQGNIENTLIRLYADGKEILEQEIQRHSSLPPEDRETDRVLRTLLRVKHRVNEPLAA
jgi:HEAT repeat protein